MSFSQYVHPFLNLVAMARRDIPASRIGQRAILLVLLLAMQGCDVAQERVYILTETSQEDLSLDSRPSQAILIEALQQFAAIDDTRCRQHIKRWDEWSCNGPNGTRITFLKDRGKDRYVAEFTLVIGRNRAAKDFREYVDKIVRFMNTRFGDAVLYVAQQ